MRHEIYRISDPLECYDEKTGAAIPYLSYDGEVFGHAVVINTGAVDATLEELVELCDHDAENRNAHDFCGTHRLLGAVLYRQHGREQATLTLRNIALFGGLHGMSGVCSKGDAFAELGVGEEGHDWSGNYGK